MDNPKSNGIVERFHSSLIEHMRIINQNTIFKYLKLKERLSFAKIPYKNSIHSTTKRTPTEIVNGTDINSNIKTEEIIVEDSVFNLSEIFKLINQQVKQSIENAKLKYSKPHDKHIDIPEEVHIKINKRNTGKIEKPIFKKVKVKAVVHERGQVIENMNKKH